MLNMVKCLISTKKRNIVYGKEPEFSGSNAQAESTRTPCTFLLRSYLSSGGTDMFHILNAADTVL